MLNPYIYGLVKDNGLENRTPNNLNNDNSFNQYIDYLNDISGVFNITGSSVSLNPTINSYYPKIVEYHRGLDTRGFSFTSFDDSFNDISNSNHFKNYLNPDKKQNIILVNNLREVFSILTLYNLFKGSINTDISNNQLSQYPKILELYKFYLTFFFYKVQWVHQNFTNLTRINTFGSLYRSNLVTSYGTFIQELDGISLTTFSDVFDISINNISDYITDNSSIQQYIELLPDNERSSFINDLSNQIQSTITLTQNTSKWYNLFDASGVSYDGIITYTLKQNIAFDQDEFLIINHYDKLDGNNKTINITNTTCFINGQIIDSSLNITLDNAKLIVDTTTLYDDKFSNSNCILDIIIEPVCHLYSNQRRF